MNAPVFLVLAGEPSGDQHAAAVVRALRARFPGCRVIGTGGREMEAAGVECLAGLDELAVMGFYEVLGRLPFFWRLERQVRALLDEGGVDLVLPVDYPGFNLRMASEARSRGIPVVYYIAPQVWAWKPHRAARLARDADRIATILPFEPERFARVGGRATFVGHPLLESGTAIPSREAFCRAVGLDPDRPVLALFPGSRRQEVRRHLDPFLEAARRLRSETPELQVAVARADGVDLDLPGEDGSTVVEEGRTLLHHATAALVKSGTTTLEAALAGVPFVVAYRTHPITFALARRLVQVDHIALANLVAEARIVPELLQGEATPERLAAAVRPLLVEGDPERERVLAGLARVRKRLGTPGAAERVVDLVEEVLAPARTGGPP